MKIVDVKFNSRRKQKSDSNIKERNGHEVFYFILFFLFFIKGMKLFSFHQCQRDLFKKKINIKEMGLSIYFVFIFCFMKGMKLFSFH